MAAETDKERAPTGAGAVRPQKVGPGRELVGYLVPPAMIVAVVLGTRLGLLGSPAVLGFLLGGLVLLPILWIFVSALWPGRADRRCPRCGRDALRRMDPRTAVGLVCRSCGHVDEDASGWLLAEEESQGLEELAMKRRGNERPRVRMGGHSDVDRRARAH